MLLLIVLMNVGKNFLSLEYEAHIIDTKVVIFFSDMNVKNVYFILNSLMSGQINVIFVFQERSGENTWDVLWTAGRAVCYGDMQGS